MPQMLSNGNLLEGELKTVNVFIIVFFSFSFSGSRVRDRLGPPATRDAGGEMPYPRRKINFI